MEQNSIHQRLTWLDEEHRKDKALISHLITQLDQHLTEIVGLRRAVQDLEERLARVQAQSLRYSQIEQALAQVKTEVTIMFDQYNQRGQQRDDDAVKIRQRERDRLEDRFVELNAKIDALASIPMNFQEDHSAIKRIEGGQIAFIRGIEETNRRIEALPPRLQALEEWTKRIPPMMADVQLLTERLRQERAEAQEVSRRADQIRARQISEWADQMKVAQREIDEWIARLKPLLDIPKETRAYVATLKELEERIKPIEPRLNQWQTVLEESRHREFDSIKLDIEKRWQQQMNEWQFLREEWSKRLAAVALRFDPLEEWRPLVADEFRSLRERMEADHQKMMTMISDLVRVQVEYEKTRTAKLDQYVHEMLTRVEIDKVGQKHKSKLPLNG